MSTEKVLIKDAEKETVAEAGTSQTSKLKSLSKSEVPVISKSIAVPSSSKLKSSDKVSSGNSIVSIVSSSEDLIDSTSVEGEEETKEEEDLEVYPYGKHYEKITKKHLKEISLKLGLITLYWPEVIPDAEKYVTVF